MRSTHGPYPKFAYQLTLLRSDLETDSRGSFDMRIQRRLRTSLDLAAYSECIAAAPNAKLETIVAIACHLMSPGIRSVSSGTTIVSPGRIFVACDPVRKKRPDSLETTLPLALTT